MYEMFYFVLEGVQSVWIMNATFQPNATNCTAIPNLRISTYIVAFWLLIWPINMVCFLYCLKKLKKSLKGLVRRNLAMCNGVMGMLGCAVFFSSLATDVLFCGLFICLYEPLCEGLRIFNIIFVIILLVGLPLLYWLTMWLKSRSSGQSMFHSLHNVM
jgi:hypothetical protein